jgi:phage terminase large subunit-like protein
MIASQTDELTRRWIRNRSDELAAQNGCYFDAERAAFAIWWIERYCKLYEGEWAGQNVLLRSGCTDVDQQILDDWEDGGREKSLARLARYEDWFATDKQVDWQYECTARLFGWSRHSARWNRVIRRFTAASIWIPKKQKKSPSLAALGVHLICGDGEQGAKCFGGAKDGNQAGIAMAHAIAMVEQSPELAAECKINRNEKSIEHLPTRSKYKPLSSANERTKTSKEGINGHILIDETHVVDRDFVKIISRAGISRAEPLHIEVSTAGNNPDGYGKERQDYARQVVSGATQNDQLFVAIYEAPQDLTDEQLAEDPLKYGRLANPAWGHTAHEEEFLADYNESRRTIAGLADFKMYRLNIWQHTANQWLRVDDWFKCAGSLELDALAGETSAAGMDLSKTQDMSALSIAVPREGGCDLFAKLWCTESFVRDNQDKADFLRWQDAGHLVVIPGDTIQEQYIRDEFARLVELLDLRILVKDRAFAADFASWCEDQYPKLLQVDYPQNAAMMEKPIDDFEAAVIEGRLRHENNGCLNWQAGHASTYPNARGHRIIMKPKRGDYRKVDGMVSSVMAYWGTKHLPKKSSVYRRRGVLTA